MFSSGDLWARSSGSCSGSSSSDSTGAATLAGGLQTCPEGVMVGVHSEGQMGRRYRGSGLASVTTMMSLAEPSQQSPSSSSSSSSSSPQRNNGDSNSSNNHGQNPSGGHHLEDFRFVTVRAKKRACKRFHLL